MNTKTLITGLAIAGAIATAQVAKANALLEVISGTTTIASTTGTGALNTQISVSGTGAGWTTTEDSGVPSLINQLDIDLSSQLDAGAANVQPLTIIYSTGAYNAIGAYDIGSQFNELEYATLTVKAYQSTSIYGSGGYAPTQLGSTMTTGGPGLYSTFNPPPVGATYVAPQTTSGTLTSPLGYYTVVVTITPDAPLINIGSRSHPNLVPNPNDKPFLQSLDIGFTGPNVPDGGVTMTLLGSIMIGLSAIRAKFGKRA